MSLKCMSLQLSLVPFGVEHTHTHTFLFFSCSVFHFLAVISGASRRRLSKWKGEKVSPAVDSICTVDDFLLVRQK